MPLLVCLFAIQISPALRQMADTELAFSALCAKVGLKKSFSHYFADDGVMFVPAPVNARKFLAKIPDRKPTAKMTWRPVAGAMSSDGSMGFEYGPVTIESPGMAPKTGSAFFSVWKRTQDGYRVAVDFGCGIANPDLLLKERLHEIPTATPPNTETGQEPTVAAAEAALMLDMDQRGWQRAIEDRTGPKTLALRKGMKATAGLAYWISKAKPVLLSWKTLSSGSAASGDMAFTYGKIAWHQDSAFGAAGEVAGHYVRVWRKDHRGHWYLAADVMNPDK